MISNDEAVNILKSIREESDPKVKSVNSEIETGSRIIGDRAFGRFWEGKVESYTDIKNAYAQLYRLLEDESNPVETVKSVKAFLDSTLVQVGAEIRKGEPLVKRPEYARYWEGKMVGLRYFQQYFERLLEPLNLVELPA